jgi:integrase
MAPVGEPFGSGKMRPSEQELHKFENGNLVLYRRTDADTPYFYARYLLPKVNKWKKFSTKADTIEKALEEARRKIIQIQTLLENNLPVDTRTFRHVADHAIKEMQFKLQAGIGKVSYNDYIRIIERYKEFFGQKFIGNISYQDLMEFDKQRSERLGRKANKSTINSHNAALSYVYDVAIQKGWLHPSQKISLKNDGKKTERRPYFTLEEYRKLFRFLRGYTKLTTKDSPQGGVKNRTIYIRELLRDYVLFLANTGIRPGTETRYLRWKNISEFEKDGKLFLQIKIPRGKTGSRTVIARHSVRQYLQRIKDRFPDLKDLKFSELGNVDAFVFRLRDGTIPKDLHGAFKRVLEECDLLKDADGNQRSLYSLRHTYATFQLLRREVPDLHLISKNMGTSIKMLEDHYSHLEVFHKADVLAGDTDRIARRMR